MQINENLLIIFGHEVGKKLPPHFFPALVELSKNMPEIPESIKSRSFEVFVQSLMMGLTEAQKKAGPKARPEKG